jgi:hypothetical protein
MTHVDEVAAEEATDNLENSLNDVIEIGVNDPTIKRETLKMF